MLYVLTGTDVDQLHVRRDQVVAAMHKKRPGAEVFAINDENCAPGQLESLIGGSGLFESKYIVLLKDLLGAKETKETVVKFFADIAESDNAFILTQNLTGVKIDAKTKKAIDRHAFKVETVGTGVAAVKPQTFNTFALADALGGRDKKQMWVLYQQAILSGSAPEEIHGILFWQMKSMLLASQTTSAGDAGLKPFVYNKAKKFAGNYKLEELKNLTQSLVSEYHESRRGGLRLRDRVEKWMLSA